MLKGEKKNKDTEAEAKGSSTLRIATYDSPTDVPMRLGKSACLDTLNKIVEKLEIGRFVGKTELKDTVAIAMGVDKAKIYMPFQKALGRCTMLKQSDENDCAYERV